MWIIFEIILLSCLSEGHDINLALNKSAYMGKQLKFYAEPNFYPVWRINDGVYNNQKALQDKAAITNFPHWFVIDLGGWYVVKKVNLFTRISCCGEGTNKFSVGLLTEFDPANFIRNELCGRFPNDTKTNKNYTLKCKKPFQVTRYVSIFRNYETTNLKNTTDFGITELEVYGEKYELTMNNYVGCYEITSFENVKKLNSPNQCISFCLSLGYMMAAFKIKNDFCFCVKMLGTKLPHILCNNFCPSNKILCGGNNIQYSVYETKICSNPKNNLIEPCNHHCKEDGKDLVRGKCPPGGCKPGYKGETCDQRVCSKNRGGCRSHSICMAETVNKLYLGDCFCDKGYEEKMILNCVDVDECAKKIDGCNSSTSRCSNTDGSYKCLCYDGFIEIDKNQCRDLKTLIDPLRLKNEISDANSNENDNEMTWTFFFLLHILSLISLVPISIYLVKKINTMIKIVEKSKKTQNLAIN